MKVLDLYTSIYSNLLRENLEMNKDTKNSIKNISNVKLHTSYSI